MYFFSAIILPSKRIFLSLDDRIKVIHLLDYVSSRVIAADFGVGRTQSQNVAKRKRDINEEYENGNPSTKRVKVNVSFERVVFGCDIETNQCVWASN